MCAFIPRAVSSEEYTNEDGLKFRFTAITLLNLVQVGGGAARGVTRRCACCQITCMLRPNAGATHA